MKKIETIFFLLAAMFILAGCSKDDNDTQEQARRMLEGKWNLVMANDKDAHQNGGYLVFSQDGQMELRYSAGTTVYVSTTLFADDWYVDDDGYYCGHLYSSLEDADSSSSMVHGSGQYPGGYRERVYVAVSCNRLVVMLFDIEGAVYIQNPALIFERAE